MTAALTVTVLGVPVPQGAIRSLGTGRPSVHANAKSLHPWRQMVAQQVRWQMGDAPVAHRHLRHGAVPGVTFTVAPAVRGQAVAA